MHDKNILAAMAIAGITLLEGVAIYKGIDGKFFLPSVAVISGLGGYSIRDIIKTRIK